MALQEIILNLNLHKRLTENDGLGRPLTLDEGDENWDKLDVAIQDLVAQLNLQFDDATTEIMPKGKGIIATDGVIDGDGRLAGSKYWYICDGNIHNTIDTPNLLNRMVVGSGDEFNTGDFGGIDQAPDHQHVDPQSGAHALLVGEMPSHKHPLSKNGKPAVFWDGFVQEAGKKANPSYAFNGSPPETGTETGDEGGNQPHIHPSGGLTSSAGGHDNKPRYYALAWIKYCRKDDE
jgi:hypothetical protein